MKIILILLIRRFKFLLQLIKERELRCAVRYFLWLINFQDILPIFVINKIKVMDIVSEMVTIQNTQKLIIRAPVPKVRREVKNMLRKASLLLPNNYFLCVVFAYRDTETQRKHWSETINEIRASFPNLPAEEIKRQARLLTAEPTGQGPHQTGGAVDVILLDEKEGLVSMGTAYRGHNEKTQMFSRFCTKEEKRNRKILRDAMIKSGFWYYPGEWWHFSYGDRMWGAYTGNNAIYGPVII